MKNLDVGCYLEVLDRMLEDRKIDPTEAEELVRLAAEFGMGPADVGETHRAYFGALEQIALADGIVTESERIDLDLVRELLGVKPASSDCQPNRFGIRVLLQEDLRGKTVCFTGQNHINGEPISREDAEALAASAGLLVVPRVTKRLDILVVADSNTLSSKAKKAREYGTRIIAEEAFWKKIGCGVTGLRSGCAP